MTSGAKEAFDRLLKRLEPGDEAARKDLRLIATEIENPAAARRWSDDQFVLEAQIEALKEANKELVAEANKAQAKLLAIVGVLGEKKFGELLTVATFEQAAKGAQDAADELRKKNNWEKGGKA